MTMREEVSMHGQGQRQGEGQGLLTPSEARLDIWARLALIASCVIFLAVVVCE